MPVIRISDKTWDRLKRWAIPLEDNPDDALRKVLDAAENVPQDGPPIETDSLRLNLQKGFHFSGRITDERGIDAKGWHRRSIGVLYDRSRGYPEVRDSITVIDIDGFTYESAFTKSLNPNNVCLGSPGKLKGWYIKKYTSDKVEDDEVYFEYTGRDREFKIYTSKEWQASQA